MTEDIIHTDITPLANPKGVHQLCERCGKRARFLCKKCKAVFYCSKEHRERDMRLIHEFLCDHYNFLKSSYECVQTCENDRKRYEKQRSIKLTEMLTIAKTLATQSLFEGRCADATCQLNVALKLGNRLYGPDSVHTILLHAMEAEAMVKQGRLDVATKQLSQAEWAMLKEKDCPDDIRADYYKNEGFINVVKKEYQLALTSYANETYFATQAYHSEHPRTACGFFHLGQVFLLIGQKNIAYSHYLHTVEIWLERLGDAFQEMKERRDETRVTAMSFEEKKPVMSQEEKGDARDAILTIVKDSVQSFWFRPPRDSAKVCLAAALYFYMDSQFEQGVKMADAGEAFVEHHTECATLLERLSDVRKNCLRALPVEIAVKYGNKKGGEEPPSSKVRISM